MDPTEDMRKHFEPDGSPMRAESAPDPSRLFCSRCGRGPLFSWEIFDGRCKESCNPATNTLGQIGEPSDRMNQVEHTIALIDAGDRSPADPLVILAEEVKRLRAALEDLATHPSDSAAFLRAKAERALR